MKIPANPYLLLTPGPLSTSDQVRAAMLRDWCTWDDDYNLGVVQEIRKRLLKLAGDGVSESEYTTILMQGSGTFSVESVISSAIARDGKLLVVVNGEYGRRIVTIAEMLGIAVSVVGGDERWHPSGEEVAAAMAADPEVSHVAVVHVETTTGMLNPVAEICMAAHAGGAVTIVDAMSSFGGIPMDIAEIGADFVVSSANKCVQGVPGFGFIIARRDEIGRIGSRARSHSLDLYAQWRTMEEHHGKWRFTSPTHTVRAFLMALEELESEGGVAARHRRYCENHHILVNGMRELGFTTFLSDEQQSPIITAFATPTSKGYDFKRFYDALKVAGFAIYPGKVTVADTFRIGNIGDIHAADMHRLIEAVATAKYWDD